MGDHNCDENNARVSQMVHTSEWSKTMYETTGLDTRDVHLTGERRTLALARLQREIIYKSRGNMAPWYQPHNSSQFTRRATITGRHKNLLSRILEQVKFSNTHKRFLKNKQTNLRCHPSVHNSFKRCEPYFQPSSSAFEEQKQWQKW